MPKSIQTIMQEASDKYGLGWNQDSMMYLMQTFMEDEQLEERFAEFIEERAEEEADL